MDAAEAGYRALDLADAAVVVANVRAQLGRDDTTDADLGALEGDADDRYSDVITTDRVILDRFRARLASTPEDFTPS